MDNVIIQLFAGLGTKYIMIAAGILVLGAVISLAKKAIKLGVIILVIAAIIFYGGTYVSKIQKQYNVSVTTENIGFTANGKDYNFELDSLTKITVKDVGGGNVYLDILGKGEGAQIKVPRFIYNVFKEKVKDYNINIKEEL